jgi:hypothetical protein
VTHESHTLRVICPRVTGNSKFSRTHHPFPRTRALVSDGHVGMLAVAAEPVRRPVSAAPHGDVHGVIGSSGELPTLLQPPGALICLPRPPSRLPQLEATLRLPPHCGVRHGCQRVQDACQKRENHLRAPRPPRPRPRAAAPWARTLDVIICP